MSGVLLSSPQLSVEVHPEHGAVISRIAFRDGPNVLWRRTGTIPRDLGADIGPAGAASVDGFDGGTLIGGWFPMAPEVGPPGAAPGARMHGEAPRISWRCERSDSRSLELSAVGPASGLRMHRTVSVTDAAMTVWMRLTNPVDGPLRVAFGEHPCFDRSLFGGGTLSGSFTEASTGSIADLSAHLLAGHQHFTWPVARTEDARTVDVSAIPEQADGRHDHVSLRPAPGPVTLTAPRADFAVALQWDVETLPAAMLWQHFLPGTSPFAGDVFAVEPSSTPYRTHEETVAAGALRTLAPGTSVAYALTMSFAPLS